jgi:hypothetical protein
MAKPNIITSLIVLVEFMAGNSSCYTTQTGSLAGAKSVPPIYRELVDRLYREPGLDVRKSRATYDITIRGKKSLMSDHQPLFVIDGFIIGTSYEQAAGSISIREASSINVLKGPDATSTGARGTNRVIKISLKSGQDNL